MGHAVAQLVEELL